MSNGRRGDSSMIIIAGMLKVPAARRDEYVNHHADLLRQARGFPGCLESVIAADPVEPDRINLFERWASEEHLAGWRETARPPAVRPEVLEAEVYKHRVSESGPPFP